MLKLGTNAETSGSPGCESRRIASSSCRVASDKDDAASASSFPRNQTLYVGGRQWGEPSTFNPLLGWNKKDVWDFIINNDVPYNPLHDQNYPSIGCWPCTQPVKNGDDERTGRWAGSRKKECGLHVIEHEEGSGI